LPATLNRNLAGRFHPGLKDVPVYALNERALVFEAVAYLRGFRGWKLMEARNKWFQQRALAILGRHYENQASRTLHCFSYAALHLFEFAREKGWRTVMQQIDPGPPEERIVARLYEANPEFRREWAPASNRYWEQWRKECALADRIVVNSSWSRESLVQEGIPGDRIRIIPLAYQSSLEAQAFARTYPAEFSTKRPLRVLFLGQIGMRKGLYPLLQAIRLVRDEPIEFWFAGPSLIAVPADLKGGEAVRWLGKVPRTDAPGLYRNADIFIFPTFSDGFGLTQLEAQAWKLPIIASRFCGDVVRDGVNGVLLTEISGTAIAGVLVDLLNQPGKLQEMSANSGVDDRFSLNAVGRALLDV